MEAVAESAALIEVEYPSIARRLQSTVLDYLFLLFTVMALSAVFENSPDWIRIAFILGFIGLYEPLCTSLGFTIGNYLSGIRVRSIDNIDKKINILQAFVRFVLKVLLGWISFLTVHSNSKRRAIHDMVVGSVMIKNYR